MPDHVHLLIQPGDGYNISKIMFSIKQFTQDINRIMGFNEFKDVPVEKADKRLSAFSTGTFDEIEWQKFFHDHMATRET
jgi:REP element-mobilizing transposase RayT